MLKIKPNSVWVSNAKNEWRYLKIERISRMGVMQFVHAHECNMYGLVCKGKRRTRIERKRFVKLFSPHREAAIEGETWAGGL